MGSSAAYLNSAGANSTASCPCAGSPRIEMEDVLGDAPVGWLADDRYAGHDREF